MKLSQTLKMAIAAQEQIAMPGFIPRKFGVEVRLCISGLCFVLIELVERGELSREAHEKARAAIQAQLTHKTRGYGYLSCKLKAQKKGSSLAHRVAWYKRWVAQLEAKGL